MIANRDVPLLIGGTWKATRETFPITNPADGSIIGSVAIATPADLEDAMAAAVQGFAIWSKTAPSERAAVLLKAAALLRQRCDEIARSITLENGKSIRESRLEVVRGCEFLEWDAGEAVRDYGRVIPSAQGIRYIVLHEPIGPVAAFTPWNFPLSQPARKIAGAIAAGCSIIIKASEETPTGVIHLAQALIDAGLPAGVLNLVFGVPAEISSALVPDDRMRLVAFTGSTAVGKALTEMASRHMKPALMELGGHAPVIVCNDVDPHRAGRISAIRKYRNSGQVCTSPTRFFVHEDLYDRFISSFVETANAIKVGNGLNEDTEMGPVANDRRLEALEMLCADAEKRGATRLCGGSRLSGPGYFFAPTAYAELKDDAMAMTTEPFGPLALINPFRSLDEAIERANALPVGLAAYGMTHSASVVDRLIREIQAGNISINTLEASVAETPFGGVKDSGLGREGGTEGLHSYRLIKNVSHQITGLATKETPCQSWR